MYTKGRREESGDRMARLESKDLDCQANGVRAVVDTIERVSMTLVCCQCENVRAA